jgi:hypothetical protein
MDEYPKSFVTDRYIEIATISLKKLFPGASVRELSEGVKSAITQYHRVAYANTHNSYTGERHRNISIPRLTDHIFRDRPILTHNGVLFKKDEVNLLAGLIQKFIDTRNIDKGEMKKHPKGSPMFEKYNMLQALDKIDANSIYGVLGERSSFFFNLYSASSIPMEGRYIVSSAGLLLESILADSVKFMSLNEVVTFIDDVCNERRSDTKILDSDISLVDCFSKVVMSCGFGYIPSERDTEIIWRLLSCCDQESLNRIYHKNNLYEFFENKAMRRSIVLLLKRLEHPFTDPNNPPEEISEELETVYSLLREWVYYGKQLIDKVDRYFNMIRHVCVLTDTDSCIVSLDKWYGYVSDMVKNVPLKIKEFDVDMKTDELKPTKMTVRNYDFLTGEIIEAERSVDPTVMISYDAVRYSIINIMAYMLGKLINEHMILYAQNSMSYREGRHGTTNAGCYLSFKNEFLFKRLLLMSVKKSYISLQEIQEGNLVPNDKQLDIKGLPIIKSITNKKIKEQIETILLEDIMRPDVVDPVKVIKEMIILEKDIHDSLASGSKDYYRPVKLKPFSVYANPWETFGIKQANAWNELRNDWDPEIDMSSSSFMWVVKTDINLKNLDRLLPDYPEVHKKMTKLLNRPEYRGVLTGIGIPENTETPEWLIGYLDYKAIINDNLTNFPLASIGLNKNGGYNNYSNILNIG